MDGQGEFAPESMDDLADFLVDNPEADESEEEEVATNDEPEEGSDEDTAEEDEESSEDEAEQQAPRKHKVTVKGEDGADQQIEVEEKELIAGYQRHADYTRKTQELANKEREVTQVMAQKHQEVQSHYVQQAQMAHAAIAQLAGLKTQQEMAVLAQTDPTAWVAEQQRAQAVQGVLSQIEHGLQSEKAKQDQLLQQNRDAALKQSWDVLKTEGIDRPKLETLYAKAAKTYQLTPEDLASIMDPKSVLVLRDAIAFRELKDKKAEVTKQAKKAPPLPAQRQSVPANEKRLSSLNKRFASGRAKLSDLASFIENS
jgi:hypothetical protein